MKAETLMTCTSHVLHGLRVFHVVYQNDPSAIASDEPFITIENAERQIKRMEKKDIKNGVYEPDRYLVADCTTWYEM